MWITLHLLISHPLFKGTKKTVHEVVSRFANIIKEVTGTEVDTDYSSEVYKCGLAFEYLFKKKHTGKKSPKWILENEEEFLKSKKFYVNKTKTKSTGEKRKAFEDLKHRDSKKKRVDSAIEEMEKDKGLPDGVFKAMKERKKSTETHEDEVCS